MRDPNRPLRALGRWTASAALLLASAAAAPGALAQERPDSATVEEASVRVGPDAARLSAEFADGDRLTVALADGQVLVDGEPRATYEPGGELEQSWRQFLRDRVDPPAPGIGASVRAWLPPTGADSAAARALEDALARLAAAAAPPAAGRGAPGARDPASSDTADLLDEETRVVPSGRSLEELELRLDEFRAGLRRVGRGALEVAGEAALVVHDDHEIEADRSVDGAVVLLSGELRVEGDVDGDVLVLDGELVLESGSSVGGDVLQVGGTVTNRGGRIGGELVSVGGGEAIARDMDRAEEFGDRLEERIERRLDEEFGPGFDGRRGGRGLGHEVWDNVTDGFRALFTTFSFFLVLAVLGAIPLYFVPSEFEAVSRTVRHSFGRSFLLGLAGQVLFVPALVVLAVGILTIPLIPVFTFAVALAFVLGYLAVGHSVGQVIRERDSGWLRDVGAGPYRTLFVGIAALLALFGVLSLLQFVEEIAEPLVVLTLLGALTVTWIAFTAGFGAVVLSYAGTRDDYAGPGAGGAPVPPGGRQPPGPGTAGAPPDEPPATGARADEAPGSGPGAPGGAS